MLLTSNLDCKIYLIYIIKYNILLYSKCFLYAISYLAIAILPYFKWSHDS